MKDIYIALAAILVIAGGWFLFGSKSVTPQEDTPFARYFEERMIMLGVADLGQPIEGFDANLLIQAYPGLAPEDFEGVKTLEGHYETDGGKFWFVRDVKEPITSAEQMISTNGYGILLSNISSRLELPINDEEDINALIRAINTAERITVRIGESASAFGVTITPRDVLEDSRCPTDVTCVWEGRVRLRADLGSGSGVANQVFEIGQPITTEVEEVTLMSVTPAPKEGVEIGEEEYEFQFLVAKR